MIQGNLALPSFRHLNQLASRTRCRFSKDSGAHDSNKTAHLQRICRTEDVMACVVKAMSDVQNTLTTSKPTKATLERARKSLDVIKESAALSRTINHDSVSAITRTGHEVGMGGKSMAKVVEQTLAVGRRKKERLEMKRARKQGERAVTIKRTPLQELQHFNQSAGDFGLVPKGPKRIGKAITSFKAKKTTKTKTKAQQVSLRACLCLLLHHHSLLFSCAMCSLVPPFVCTAQLLEQEPCPPPANGVEYTRTEMAPWLRALKSRNVHGAVSTYVRHYRAQGLIECHTDGLYDLAKSDASVVVRDGQGQIPLIEPEKLLAVGPEHRIAQPNGTQTITDAHLEELMVEAHMARREERGLAVGGTFGGGPTYKPSRYAVSVLASLA